MHVICEGAEIAEHPHVASLHDSDWSEKSDDVCSWSHCLLFLLYSISLQSGMDVKGHREYFCVTKEAA